MTLFEEYIYWTDWETKSINRAHKTLGTNKTMLISTLHRPMDLHIYHPSRQPEGEKIHTCCKWKCSCSVWCGFWAFSSVMLLWLQCQITRVRWIMVAAVTCVWSHPEEAISVPVPPTSFWLLMENSACPTVQPARWVCVCVCVCVSLAQISKHFPEMQNASTF